MKEQLLKDMEHSASVPLFLLALRAKKVDPCLRVYYNSSTRQSGCAAYT